MATHRIPILGPATVPDASGNVWPELASLTQTNDRYPQIVWRFKDSATKDTLGGTFIVPQNYVGTAKVYVYWTSTATSGNVVWGFDYTSIGGDDAESLDPSADQESLTVTDAAPTASQRLLQASVTLTAGNLAGGDLLQFIVSRVGTGADTMAADAVLYAAVFEYADV
jgi:hypothetical protein